MKYRINKLPDIESVRNLPFVCYGVKTCWWGDRVYYTIPGTDMPCDPRGGVMMQTEKGDFVERAEKNPSHYGEYGIQTFLAAFHGVIEVQTDRGWRPTCFETWPEYEEAVWNYRINGGPCEFEKRAA